MSKDVKNVPALRFKGYSDAWEKRKLGEIARIFDGTHQTPNYQSSGIMFLSVENIQTLKSNKFISLEDFQKDFKVSPRTGDILMTRIGNIGTTNVVKSTRPIAYYVSLALIRPNDAIDVYYLNYAINGLSFQRELRRRTLSVAFPQKINKQEIGKSIVDLPSPSEQIQIGNLFVLLDNLIAATQDSIEALGQAKKALLQHLFDQSWRFKGYSDPWEKRKLGELIDHKSGKAIEKYFDNDGALKVISIGSYGLDNRYVDQGIRAISNTITQSRIINKNELAMVLNDKTANGSIIGRTLLIQRDREYVANQRTEIIHPKDMLDSGFTYFALNGIFRNSVKKIVQGGTQIYVNFSAIALLPLKIPTLSEQKKIQDFFKILTHLIAATQSRLSSLESLKKSLLQDLFI
ncbi:restriction endonuclease subunit S [Lacticaseibacillus paracasei]|uniref:restriction endonuclease subunit S n=1 Tax=Lacticaseibacillus paracasei TaxID=1597 RepID=UPI0011F3522F|nr:restriction endonuclease subunit S [Lacticaseibacillus paracasei]KAA1052284.1 restriction endonuclease subunit S [Lacticaseibacillus paracasei]